MEHISPYARQYNDPNDLDRAGWNARQVEQQRYLSQLSGGSWSQPPWMGWHPIKGASAPRHSDSSFFQRYAQDGDMGFFWKGSRLWGQGEPLGANAMPLNHLEQDDVAPLPKEDGEVSTAEPRIVTEPSPVPIIEDLRMETTDAEPEQHALHVPPYSHLLRTGFGKDSALYEEPLELPKRGYGGSLHRKKKAFSK